MDKYKYIEDNLCLDVDYGWYSSVWQGSNSHSIYSCEVIKMKITREVIKDRENILKVVSKFIKYLIPILLEQLIWNPERFTPLFSIINQTIMWPNNLGLL